MTKTTVNETERMVVPRVFDPHANWFGGHTQTRNT